MTLDRRRLYVQFEIVCLSEICTITIGSAAFMCVNCLAIALYLILSDFIYVCN